MSLESPFVFDSRRLLHAGHSSQAHGRVIILAFSTIHASTLPWWVVPDATAKSIETHATARPRH